MARPHTFVEIDHEIFSAAILLRLIQERLLSVASEFIHRVQSMLGQEKSVVRLADRLDMSIGVDWGV